MSFSVSYTFEAVDRFSGVANKLNQQITTTTEKINRLGNTMKMAGEKLGRFGRSMTLKATAPILLFGGLATKTFLDFEKSMNMVGAVTKSNAKQLDQLKQAAIDMGAKTQYSARQVAQAEVFLGLAGKHTGEIISVLPKVLQLAASAQLDMGSAANIVLNIMAGYNLKADQLTRVNDVLTATFTNTKTDLTALGDAMRRVGPYGSRLGVSFEETAASLGLLANAGFTGGVAGRLFARAMIQMIKPSADAMKQMKKHNLVFTDQHGKLLDLVYILKELRREQVTGAGYALLFGARAGPLMSKLVAQGSDALADLTKKLKESGGLAQTVAEAQMKGLIGSFYRLRAALEHVRIVFISRFEPTFIKVIQAITKWVLGMANSSSSTKKFIVIALALLAGLGPLSIALGHIAVVLFVLQKMGIVAVVIKAIGTSFRFLWRGILGPIGLIITLITILPILYRKFKIVKDIIDSVVHAFRWFHNELAKGRGTYMQINPPQATRVSPIIEHARPATKVHSTLDINVHDRENLIKSIATQSSGEMNINLGQNMAMSR